MLPGFGVILFVFGLFTVLSVAAFWSSVSVIKQLASVGWAVTVALLVLYVIAYALMTFGFWWTVIALWFVLIGVIVVFRLA